MQRENDILNINPSKPDGISHCYQLDQFISVLRVQMSGIFHFYSNFNRTIGDPD